MQQRKKIRNYLLIPLLAISLAIALNNLLLLLDIAQYSERYAEAVKDLYTPPLHIQLVYYGVLIPVMEEMIFRGVLFGLLRKKLSFGIAMLISSVVFGIYHGNLVQFVYATLCGFLFAYLQEMYASVKAPILAHTVMNMVVCVMTEYGAFTWILAKIERVILVTLPCLIVLAVFFWKTRKVAEKSNL